MRKKLETHESLVVASLKDPELAASYLNEHWHYRGPKRVELLMKAIHRVALARGITKVSKESGISRRALYKIFSEEGNPTAETLLSLLDTLGVGIRFDASRKKARPKREEEDAA